MDVCFCEHTHMILPNIIHYIILTLEVKRGHWRYIITGGQTRTTFGNCPWDAIVCENTDMISPKYYRLC